MEVFAGCIVICYRPRDEPSDRRRPPGAAQGRRVQAPAHALARRRRGNDLPVPPPPGVGNPGRFKPQTHPQRARPRLPHARAGRRLRPQAGGVTAESPHRIRSPAAPHGVRSSSSVVVSPCVVCTPFNSDFWYTEADVGLQVPPVSWLYYNGLGFPSRTDGLVRTTQYANECH